MLILIVVVCMIFEGLPAVAANPADGVRVYAIEPASFDYVFTAIASSSSTNPVLPGIWSSSGYLIRPTMVIPRRFETRSAGLSIEYR